MRDRLSDVDVLLQAIWALHFQRYRTEHVARASKVQLGIAREYAHEILAKHSLLDALVALCRFYDEDFWRTCNHALTMYKKHIDTLLAHAKMGTPIGGKKNASEGVRAVVNGDEDFEREQQAFEARCKR